MLTTCAHHLATSVRAMNSDNLSFNKPARRSGMIYLVLAAGTVFALAVFSIKPEVHCVEYDCPGWLRGIAGGFGAFLALGALAALMTNSEWGSRVDRERRRLVWWNGAPPRKEHSFEIDGIAVVRVETKWDSDKILFRDDAGKIIDVLEICVPAPYLEWAKAFTQEFPHAKLETD
jgi:hypothetical protein